MVQDLDQSSARGAESKRKVTVADTLQVPYGIPDSSRDKKSLKTEEAGADPYSQQTSNQTLKKSAPGNLEVRTPQHPLGRKNIFSKASSSSNNRLKVIEASEGGTPRINGL